ncbi:lysosomal-associated transmembrane protein 4B [Culicoides brevitarsis]|uniref:lysosomal-associated transmembrane protein 4B n=1 Tax=Culicoides brevitarsis TaxID=469753 RepID=UPI00307C0632
MQNKEWSCIFGLHVRTVTILIGIWHLFLNVLALGFLAVIVRNPSMINELQNFEDSLEAKEPALPTPLSVDQQQYAFRGHSLNNHNIDMSGLVCLCMISISLMLIYGTIKGKPTHILPFFCLQLFDFAITALTAAGYLCYIRSIHRIIAENQRLPWRDELLKLSPQTLSIVVLCSFLSIVFLKAYVIGIIWRCYKFLVMRQHRSVLPYIIPEVTYLHRDSNSLLPDYEEAILKRPPPSYSVAVASLPQVDLVLPSTSFMETTPPAYSSLCSLAVPSNINQKETLLPKSIDENTEIIKNNENENLRNI